MRLKRSRVKHGMTGEKMQKRFVIFLLFVFVIPQVRAEDAPIDMSRAMEISSLKREISELETKLAECSRKNKNWKTATWIGAAGVATTGTAAIVQGVKLNKLKRENEFAGKNPTEKPAEAQPDEKK